MGGGNLALWVNKLIDMKILTIDLETTPLVAYSWGPVWEASLIEVTTQMTVLSYSAKWLDGKHVTKGWPDYPGYKKGKLNDRAIVRDIWNLLNEADVVVAQNGRAFDIKILNARFLFHKLPPPSPYKLIDTVIEARKHLRLPSYKLNDICNYYGIGSKVEHEGFPLWKKCMAGNMAAWRRMLRYNHNDIALTEKLYLLLLPYIKHPDRNLTDGTRGKCPNCGSDKIIKRGYARVKNGRKAKLQCNSCGAWHQGEREKVTRV